MGLAVSGVRGIHIVGSGVVVIGFGVGLGVGCAIGVLLDVVAVVLLLVFLFLSSFSLLVPA